MTRCINTDKSLRYTNSGDVALCCKSELWLNDEEGNKCNISTHDFNAPLNGKLATEIRNDLNNGVRHANCKKCWDEEDAGIASKRILDNSRAIEYWGEDFLTDGIVEPAIVELNLGTLCNLKCRICGPWSSSNWVNEHYVVNTPEEKQSKDHKKLYMQQVKKWQGNFEDDSPTWKHIEDSLPHLKQIDIYGGEPFMVEKQWEVLQKSIDMGYSKEQTLHFNTNTTIYSERHVEILRQFKTVLISLSLDDIEDRFEFQRHPAKWDLVSDNIQKFLDLHANNENITVVACITINNLNVFYLPEIIDYFEAIGLNYYTNILHGPPHYNIKNLPHTLKEIITNKYKESMKTSRDYKIERLRQVMEFMNSFITTNNEWINFIEFTEKKDKFRKESFSETFAEWSSIIKENQ